MAGRQWTRAKDKARFMRAMGVTIPRGVMDRSDPKGTSARLDAIWEASPQRREMDEAVKARLRARGFDPDKPETWPTFEPLDPLPDPPALPGADFQLPDPASQGDDPDKS